MRYISTVSNKHGYIGVTIVELLVVVAIMGLLIAVLLPAMGNVRTQSKRIECLSHLKSLGSTVAVYSNVHKDMAPSIPLFGSPNAVNEAVARLEFPNSPAFLQSSYFAQSSIFTWIIAVATDGDLDRETCPSQPSSKDLGDGDWFHFNGRDIRKSSYVMSRAFIADPTVFDSATVARLGHLRAMRMTQVKYPSAKALLFETKLYHEPAWWRGGGDWDSLLVPMVFADGHGLLDEIKGFSEGELAMNTGVTPRKLFDTPGGVLGRDLK